MADQDITEILAGRGCTLDLDDGDMVTDAIVLCRVSNAEGGTSLGIALTEGTSWFDQFGLVKAAENMLDQGEWRSTDDDD